MERNSRLSRLFGVISRSDSDAEAGAPATAAAPDLQAIRSALVLAVASCTEAHRLRALHRIERATSVLELWLMRADIFQYLAQDIGQTAAEQHIDRLTPLFKDFAPGVAAHRKSLDNATHDDSLH